MNNSTSLGVLALCSLATSIIPTSVSAAGIDALRPHRAVYDLESERGQ